MRKIGAVLIILSMTLPLYAEGGGESATMEPERGIWIWGVPRGPFEGELLDVSNEWALEKFGITVDRVDKVPTGQTADQALQLLIAQDQFPDLMWNMPFTTMAALAAGGRLLPLDKYFRDSVNYPIIASACQSYMSKYKVNGQIYGLPGWEWAVKCEDVSMDVLWYIRKDLYEEHGNPQTTDELLDLLRAVKASGLTDLKGDPVIPFQWRSAWSPVNSRVIYQLKGAGWEVDAESRLLPEWASVETYEAFKFLNLLWNEDLLGKGQFIMDTAGFQDLLKTASIAVATGEPWYASLITDVVPALIEEHGRDAPQTQAALDSQLLIMANPIKDAPGRIVNKQPNPSLVSADIPNPDGVMSFIQWHMTDEGRISNMFAAGYLGVHWDFVEGPEVWRMKPELQGKNPHDTRQIANSQDSVEITIQAGRPPLVTPHAHWFGTPNYGSWQPRLTYHSQQSARENGIIRERVGDLSAVVSAIPSYSQLTVALPPREASAVATALERFDAALAGLVTSSDFEADYDAFVASMIGITDWRPIFEERQQRWEQWMSDNNVDDRESLHTVTPRAEWAAVMGW
ncbi:MAG: extracellular solute-binding protein [Spirochaetaceae bacterium]|nr:extracellular solute-binding protein [Spirochaetaceae bacterium]